MAPACNLRFAVAAGIAAVLLAGCGENRAARARQSAGSASAKAGQVVESAAAKAGQAVGAANRGAGRFFERLGERIPGGKPATPPPPAPAPATP